MEKITRKINYKTTECVVYTTDDCPHPMVYWKSAAKGDWATTDDGYVAECIAKNVYTDKSGRVKTLIKLTCGLQWNTGNSKLLYKPNKEAAYFTGPGLDSTNKALCNEDNFRLISCAFGISPTCQAECISEHNCGATFAVTDIQP